MTQNRAISSHKQPRFLAFSAAVFQAAAVQSICGESAFNMQVTAFLDALLVLLVRPDKPCNARIQSIVRTVVLGWISFRTQKVGEQAETVELW